MRIGRLFLTTLMAMVILLPMTPVSMQLVRAIPDDVIWAGSIDIEIYWATTADGTRDFPEEDEWIALYWGADLAMAKKVDHFYFRTNITTDDSTFAQWIEFSITFTFPNGYWYTSNSSGLSSITVRLDETQQYMIFNSGGNIHVTVLSCYSTTTGYHLGRGREFNIVFPIITTSTITSTITASTTTSTITILTPLDFFSSPVFGIALMLITTTIVIGGAQIYSQKRKLRPDARARVLVICPFCGAKTEQGITRCQHCDAPL
jgi:hypothetical protein